MSRYIYEKFGHLQEPEKSNAMIRSLRDSIVELHEKQLVITETTRDIRRAQCNISQLMDMEDGGFDFGDKFATRSPSGELLLYISGEKYFDGRVEVVPEDYRAVPEEYRWNSDKKELDK